MSVDTTTGTHTTDDTTTQQRGDPTMSDTTQTHVPPPITVTVEWQLSAVGQRAAVLAGLPAQQDQTCERALSAEDAAVVLPACDIDAEGRVRFRVSHHWPEVGGWGPYTVTTHNRHAFDEPGLDPIHAWLTANIAAQAERDRQNGVWASREQERRVQAEEDHARQEARRAQDAQREAEWEQQKAQRHAARLALIATHGDPSQLARAEAGVLPEEEWTEIAARAAWGDDASGFTGRVTPKGASEDISDHRPVDALEAVPVASDEWQTYVQYRDAYASDPTVTVSLGRDTADPLVIRMTRELPGPWYATRTLVLVPAQLFCSDDEDEADQ